MNLLKRSVPRLAICVAVFLMVWFVGVFATARMISSSETLFRGWLNGLEVFKPVGLFPQSNDEDVLDAVLSSLACLWLPVAAWVAWWLNRRLKRLE